MAKQKKLYDESSIESLSPLEFTRLRPQVYAGDCTYSTQLLVEIVSNAIDEFRLGHGNRIEVSIDKDIVSVRDYGQGFIPNVKREDGKTILEAAFSVLNTSGKYREDGTYEGTSLGSFGIGSKITTFLSHYLKVWTVRDNKIEQIIFKEGVFNDRISGVEKAEPTGTRVEWQASEEFFTHPEVEINVVKELFKTTACLCPGLTISLNNNGEITEYHSANGLDDYVDDKVGSIEILKKRFRSTFTNGKNQMDMILTYVSNYSSTIIPYVNTGLTEKGPHITAIKGIITREFNKFFRDQKWIKDKEENLTGEDIQEGSYVVFNITAPNVGYDAQVKSNLTKIDMAPFMTQLTEDLRAWLEINKNEVKTIADKALAARKAREAAKKARDNARNSEPKAKGLKAKMQLSDKFIDCSNKNPSQRNLLLVEGLSAGSSAIEARNVKTDCIYMLRGKILSTLKTTKDKIFANQELSDIIRVIGAGFDKEFDINKMQFDKIVITSDQDSDGMNIELLLITFFYTYMRPLVEAGKLYRAVTPLYIVKRKGKEDLYFYTDEELETWEATNKATFELVRCKGLGEIDPKDLKAVCFEQERFKRITVSDAKETEKLLETLMGTNVNPRKQYIYDNATRLGFNFQ